jgi:hypothetical protein
MSNQISQETIDRIGNTCWSKRTSGNGKRMRVAGMAKVLEQLGWEVRIGREWNGSSGRATGLQGIRTSNGHESHGTTLIAKKDGQVIEHSAWNRVGDLAIRVLSEIRKVQE